MDKEFTLSSAQITRLQDFFRRKALSKSDIERFTSAKMIGHVIDVLEGVSEICPSRYPIDCRNYPKDFSGGIKCTDHHAEEGMSWIEQRKGSLFLNDRKIILMNPLALTDSLQGRMERYAELVSRDVGISSSVADFLAINMQVRPRGWCGLNVIFPGSKYGDGMRSHHACLHDPDEGTQRCMSLVPIVPELMFPTPYMFAVFK
jgi:hypothetical protein